MTIPTLSERNDNFIGTDTSSEGSKSGNQFRIQHCDNVGILLEKGLSFYYMKEFQLMTHCFTKVLKLLEKIPREIPVYVYEKLCLGQLYMKKYEQCIGFAYSGLQARVNENGFEWIEGFFYLICAYLGMQQVDKAELVMAEVKEMQIAKKQFPFLEQLDVYVGNNRDMKYIKNAYEELLEKDETLEPWDDSSTATSIKGDGKLSNINRIMKGKTRRKSKDIKRVVPQKENSPKEDLRLPDADRKMGIVFKVLDNGNGYIINEFSIESYFKAEEILQQKSLQKGDIVSYLNLEPEIATNIKFMERHEKLQSKTKSQLSVYLQNHELSSRNQKSPKKKKPKKSEKSPKKKKKPIPPPTEMKETSNDPIESILNSSVNNIRSLLNQLEPDFQRPTEDVVKDSVSNIEKILLEMKRNHYESPESDQEKRKKKKKKRKSLQPESPEPDLLPYSPYKHQQMKSHVPKKKPKNVPRKSLHQKNHPHKNSKNNPPSKSHATKPKKASKKINPLKNAYIAKFMTADRDQIIEELETQCLQLRNVIEEQAETIVHLREELKRQQLELEEKNRKNRSLDDLDTMLRSMSEI